MMIFKPSDQKIGEHRYLKGYFVQRRHFLQSLPAASLALGSVLQEAQAQDAWPQKAVKLVVPYSAGGSADTLGRLASLGLADAFKQPFVIDNKGGAGGIIGSEFVKNSAPDGYSLVVSGIGSHVIAPVDSPNSFDPIKDFSHIAILGGPPLALAVNANVPVNDLNGFIEYCKKLPGGLSWASPGKGTHGYLIGKLFQSITKSPMVHVGYKGASPAMADLVAGQIPASFTTLTTASPHILGGRLKAIAVTSNKRMKEFPNVPTFAELGFKQLTSVTWFSLSGPAGMSPSLMNRINAEVRRIMHTSSVQEQLAKDSMETFDWDVAKFNQFFVSEVKRWGPLATGLKGED
jgi:tripartite-type tricarboxylate transporter receptor subunit TctC